MSIRDSEQIITWKECFDEAIDLNIYGEVRYRKKNTFKLTTIRLSNRYLGYIRFMGKNH
jgi:hypothetical protein